MLTPVPRFSDETATLVDEEPKVSGKPLTGVQFKLVLVWYSIAKVGVIL